MREISASLYIHIPFCVRKCLYCDFASYEARPGDPGRYHIALLEEARRQKALYGTFPIPSVFIGGGTPTSLNGDELPRLISGLWNIFTPDSDAEITVEANPGTVDLGLLKALRSEGVNRISFGAQSFDDVLLKTIGRIHTSRDIIAAVEFAHEAGFENISLDLMYALPGQTMDTWRKTLETALSLGLRHISCYSLINEEGTPLTRMIESGILTVPGDDECLEMQKTASVMLSARGLERYEISNYAVPGYESRHNMRYWRRGDYLGLGCAAHSLMRGSRFHNDETIDGYLSGKRYTDSQALTPDEELEEAVMLETRTTAGICKPEFDRRYGVSFDAVFGEKALALASAGLAVNTQDIFRLTDKGLDVHNAVISELIDAI